MTTWSDLLLAGLRSAIEYESVLWDKELTEGLAALRDEQMYIRFLDEAIQELRRTQEKLSECGTEAYSTEATGHVSHDDEHHELRPLCLGGASLEGVDYAQIVDTNDSPEAAQAQSIALPSAPADLSADKTPADQLTSSHARSSESFQDLSLGNPPSAETDQSNPLVVRMTTTQLWWQYTCESRSEYSDSLTEDEISAPLLQSGSRHPSSQPQTTKDSKLQKLGCRWRTTSCQGRALAKEL